MKFLESLQIRYATKLYDATKKIDDATITEIAEILRLSPSSINSQPWQFTIVTNPELKARLAECSLFNRKKIEDAPVLVVLSVYNNIAKFEEQIARELPQSNVDYYNNVVKPQGEEATKWWLKNQLYISVGVLLSGCATMGLDSTPMEGIEPEMYDSILGNVDYRATVAVAIGYRSIEDTNQPEIHPKQRCKMEDVVVMKR